ncbi:MAG: haloacid dehalogenase-like hydrolase [Cyclobacteriaceae bacterium]|nr:haloacid dehalogenase-like hydrolase [Cyclobacteriaceae bacterium]
MKSSQILVLFDFDGTITSRDTLFAFAEFISGRLHFLFGLFVLSPILIGNRLRLVSAQRAKEAFLTYYFRGLDLNDFNERCTEFALVFLNEHIRLEALSAIQNYSTNDVRMVIVSASPENWIIPWAQRYNIEVISTRLEVQDGKLTGKLKGKNCNNEEKAARILQEIDLSKYSKIIAYGDSAGDQAMFSLANETHFKPFRGNNG